MAAGDRVELDAARRVPARRGCGFPTVNQTWREGRSSGEGDDRERKNRSFGKDVAHRCSIARQGGGFSYKLVVRDGHRADVVVVMTKDNGGLGAVKSCGRRWRGLVQVAVLVGVVSRLRHGSRKTDAVGMPAAWRRCCRGAMEVP